MAKRAFDEGETPEFSGKAVVALATGLYIIYVLVSAYLFTDHTFLPSLSYYHRLTIVV